NPTSTGSSADRARSDDARSAHDRRRRHGAARPRRRCRGGDRLAEALAMSASPTCRVAFADHEVTLMTVYNGDLARAVRLARAAYKSRKKRPAPNIIAMQFTDLNGEPTTLMTGLELGLALAFKGILDEACPDGFT